MNKDKYQAPLVELVRLGGMLSFLTQSFSSEGELNDWGDGGGATLATNLKKSLKHHISIS